MHLMPDFCVRERKIAQSARERDNWERALTPDERETSRNDEQDDDEEHDHHEEVRTRNQAHQDRQ